MLTSPPDEMPEISAPTQESSMEFLGLKSGGKMKIQEEPKLNIKNLSIQEGNLEKL
jgi:hypothetical protein